MESAFPFEYVSRAPVRTALAGIAIIAGFTSAFEAGTSFIAQQTSYEAASNMSSDSPPVTVGGHTYRAPFSTRQQARLSSELYGRSNHQTDTGVIELGVFAVLEFGGIWSIRDARRRGARRFLLDRFADHPDRHIVRSLEAPPDRKHDRGTPRPPSHG